MAKYHKGKIRGVKFSLKWNGDKFTAALLKEFIRRLYIIAQNLEAAGKKNVSTSFKAAGASKPGAFPHLREGDLRQSVFAEVDEARLVVIFGSTEKHGYFLEVGTVNMAARPYLRSTELQMRKRTIKTLGRFHRNFEKVGNRMMASGGNVEPESVE